MEDKRSEKLLTIKDTDFISILQSLDLSFKWSIKNVRIRVLLHRQAIKATGENISPCRTTLEILKWSDMLSPIRTQPDATLKIVE